MVANYLTHTTLHICITQKKFGINDFSISIRLEPCLFIIDRSCLTPSYLLILTCFPSCIYLPILPHSLLFALIFNFYLSSDLRLYLQHRLITPLQKSLFSSAAYGAASRTLGSCPATPRPLPCIPAPHPPVLHLHGLCGAQRILHQSVSGSKPGGKGNMLENRAAGLKDLNKVDKWSDKHLAKFKKGKCKICPLLISIARLEI